MSSTVNWHVLWRVARGRPFISRIRRNRQNEETTALCYILVFSRRRNFLLMYGRILRILVRNMISQTRVTARQITSHWPMNRSLHTVYLRLQPVTERLCGCCCCWH